jgi:peptidyl-prolyl cis-trans isomerase C
MSQRIASYFTGMFALVFVAAAAVAAAPDDEVLLTRGDVTVTRGDLMHMIEVSFPQGARESVLADNKKVRQIIADIFIIRTLAAEGQQAGFADDPLVKFKTAIQHDRALMDAVLEKTVADAGNPDFEKLARERYDTNPGQFVEAEQVRASHILIAPREGRSKEQARALAEDVRKQALEGKKSFEDLALEFSDDQSAKSNKGDLGFFERKRMVKPFADAAFAMSKPGEIAPVVESQFGFHIIKYVGRKPERTKSFDEVKAMMIDQDRQQYTARVRTEKIESVRSLDGIKVNQEAVTAISAKGATDAKSANDAKDAKRVKHSAP